MKGIKKMRKIMGILFGVALVVAPAIADMNNREYTISTAGAVTNSASYVLRGVLKAIDIDVPTGTTGTVTVASANETLFTKSVSADDVLRPLYASDNSTGGEISSTYVEAALAGPIEVSVINTGTGTVSWVVELIYDK